MILGIYEEVEDAFGLISDDNLPSLASWLEGGTDVTFIANDDKQCELRFESERC